MSSSELGTPDGVDAPVTVPAAHVHGKDYAHGVQRFSVRVSVLAAAVACILASTGAPALARTSTVDRVRLPFPAYDGTLTPYTFSLGYPLVTLVYDTLLWRDAAGIPQPWLARSVTRSRDSSISHSS